MSNLKERGAILKELRTKRGYSQRELSELSGVNLRMIQHYEQGIKPLNTAQGMTLYKLAKSLECNMEDLITIDNETP